MALRWTTLNGISPRLRAPGDSFGDVLSRRGCARRRLGWRRLPGADGRVAVRALLPRRVDAAAAVAAGGLLKMPFRRARWATLPSSTRRPPAGHAVGRQLWRRLGAGPSSPGRRPRPRRRPRAPLAIVRPVPKSDRLARRRGGSEAGRSLRRNCLRLRRRPGSTKSAWRRARWACGPRRRGARRELALEDR